MAQKEGKLTYATSVRFSQEIHDHIDDVIERLPYKTSRSDVIIKLIGLGLQQVERNYEAQGKPRRKRPQEPTPWEGL